MYLQNVGYRWNCIEPEVVNGVVFGACHQTIEDVLRRAMPQGIGNLLFDPQLYAIDFDITPGDYSKLLTNLATYPWFGMDAPSYESQVQSKRDWKGGIAGDLADLWNTRVDPRTIWSDAVRSAVELQERLGVASVILPGTLIQDPESSVDGDFDRLDEAIAVAREVTSKPLLASLPIDEGAIRHRPFMENELLDALVDQLSARADIAGVYLPVASSGAKDKLSSLNAVGAVLRLVNLVRESSELDVIVNYVESLGLVTLSLGARAFASGYGLKQKRFCISDFRDSGGGLPLPKFLALNLLLDLYPERDLEKLRDARLLRLVRNDRTQASAPLLDALSRGLGAADVPAWEERRSNTAAAQSHYHQVQRARVAAGVSDPDETLIWLQSAEASALYLSERFKDDPLSSDRSHITPWRNALERILSR